MFRLFLLSFTLITITSLSAQSRYGYLLHDSTVYSTTSLSNTFYVGIDNYLHVASHLFNQYDNVVLKCNNGYLKKDSTFFVIPRRPGNLRIEVHGAKNSKIDTIGYSNFKVLPLPIPKIVFNTTIIDDSMRIAQSAFLEADSISILITDDIPESSNWIQIREFSIGYNYGGYFIEKNSSSNKITREMKGLIASQGAGRWFSIKVITQSGSALLLTNPMYKVFFY